MWCRCGTVAVSLLAVSLTGVVHADPTLRMRAPMTYVIDYSKKFLEDAANILAYRDAPPDLMHVGKSVPILHLWGPVPLLEGENQFTGGPKHTLNWDAIRLLSPKELEERIAMLTAYTKRWHDIGVRTLVPYSSYHTLAGDHEKREGFWKFYDHWGDYEKWLGPRPAEDPTQWLMVDKEGKIVPGACGGYAPAYFAPLHRYCACPEHPEWRKLQARLTELIAEVGYDGIFPDNSNPTNQCFCKHCCAGLKQFTKGLSPEELEILGVNGDPGQVDLLSADTSSELIRRYRIDTSARYQRMVRDAGRRIKPDFIVFPNVNSYSTFMPLSEACDVLMFESTYSPGCNFVGAPPDDPFVSIRATDGAADASREKFHLQVESARTFVEFSAMVEFPRVVRCGKPADLKAKIESVGGSNEDNDWAEGFAFLLVDMASGQEERVALTPEITVGGGNTRPQAKRPPVDLEGRWTPTKAGRFKLCIAYKYTDEGHTDVARELPCRHELSLSSLYQTHIGQLMFTMHAGARTVLLDYECRKKGRESVQELGMAECAAFSSGSAIASMGEPREKYARFFRRAKSLYEGAEPYADIGVLYSYWCHNSDGMGLGPPQELTPAEDLAGSRRLIKVLMDRTIGESDLAGLKTLILFGHRLEAAPARLDAIRKFAQGGGRLCVYRPETTVNGKPVAEVLPEAVLWKPGLEVPGMKPLTEAAGVARGLRFSAFTHDAPRRVALHVVNYNVPHRESPANVTEARNVPIALTLPTGWTATAVTVHDPDTEAAADLSFKSAEGGLSFELPSVRVYKVVEILAR